MGRFKSDTLIAAGAYVDREYGNYGYRLAPVTSTLGGGGIFEVSHSDGSTFRIMADQWGNVARVPDDAPDDAIADFFRRASSV